MKEFQDKMLRYIRNHQLIVPNDTVLVGCSGGVDSMVLLHFLKSQQEALKITVLAVHVNHMLRGEESLEDRLFTEEVCRHWKIPCFSRDIPIPLILKESSNSNKQQVCRTERYAYFKEIMQSTQATKVATAHHADDQVETVLMGALRGTLQLGAFGIPVKRPFEEGQLIRPQMAVTKDEIMQYARFHHIKHREDPSNAQQVYTRNRMRQVVLPLLKKESSDVSEKFVELAEDMQLDQNFLQALAKEKLQALVRYEDKGIMLSAKEFRMEAPALQKRMVLLLLNYLYNEKQVIVTKQLVEQVQKLMRSSAGTVFLHLPKNCMMVRQYDAVRFTDQPLENEQAGTCVPLTEEWSEAVHGFSYKVMPLQQAGREGDVKFWYFSASGKAHLMLRTRKPGDRIQLAGMEKPKKVSRLMIDEKVPVSTRESWPVIATETDEILLIPGIRPSAFINRVQQDGDNWVLVERNDKIAKSGL
ncbi:tRNA lysidine(34) synthetase TilS [Planococcus salinus]|uniref:tRNA(Ile)-lysidine synthase n=1 Tax=Planococcus salinus TaxID=1848460 RepID=A0A3M8P3V0_9BACL|nr:tRNA lysidine(34) synthetase TilS [Planococcus salinus]RNF38345.1 tRNA lysidine(34) synthetase TilS [Planococcus salinus]